MNFFEHQEVARKKTGRLVALFVLAVLAITVMVYVAVQLAFSGAAVRAGGTARWLDWQVLAVTAAGVWLVVFLGSAYKLSSLRGGGPAVADSLGGRRLEPGSADPSERRLLNVVEEMAIASGTPVPPVYVMDDERAINAFAAGFTPSDAVIGVTRGCMERLSRDELQGVVAHEFSHVFNGDMRLNLRLIGVLHGILVLGLVGQGILRASFYSGGGRRRRGRDSRGSGAQIAFLGLALVVIGWIGTFFGSLIKAAVSRQREFLADASAVQFTRNPEGISGALKKIGGLSSHGYLKRANAAEVSHMLFGQGFRQGFSELFATHPPLVERIRRIEPRFDGAFEEIDDEEPSPYAADGPYGADAELAAASAGFLSATREARVETEREAAALAPALALVGEPGPAHLQRAAEIRGSLPEPVLEAAREPFGARALVYGLLLDVDPEVRARQEEVLEASADPEVRSALLRLQGHVDGLDPTARLPLVDLALPALRELSPRQYETFRENVVRLVRADERVDAFEWVLRRILLRHLDEGFRPRRRTAPQYYSLARLAEPCAVLLSVLARVGQPDEDDAASAFRQGAARLPLTGLELLPREACRLRALDEALGTLERVSAPLKRVVLEAGAATIATDQEVTSGEAELFRAIADALGCPVPPVLPGQALVA